jgi:hypothetical protein
VTADELARALGQTFAAGDFAGSLPLSARLLRACPERAVVWRLHARALAALGRHDEACDTLAQALRHCPDDLPLRVALGKALTDRGRLREAGRCFREALTLEPRSLAAFSGLLGCETVPPDHPYVTAVRAMAEDSVGDPDPRAFACFLAGRALVAARRDAEGFRYYALGNLLADGVPPPAAFDVTPWRQAFDLAPARLAAVREQRRALAPDDCPAVIVAGLPRSGKSLVESLLARLPGLVPGGEAGGLAEVVGEATPAEVARHASRERVSPLAARYRRLCASLDAPAGHRVIDTSPGNLRLLGVLGALHPEVPVVLCRRDPLDLGVAIHFRKFRHGHAYSRSLPVLGTTLAAAEDLIEHWSRVLPNPVLQLRYEAVVADPGATLARLATFVGAPGPSGAATIASGVKGADEPALHPGHSPSSFSRIDSGLVGFGRRFERQMAPMMTAYHASRGRRWIEAA